MRTTFLIATLIAFLTTPFSAARAWWDEGHMQIAYLAYQRLDPPDGEGRCAA
jgi:hypothetical protein